MSDPTLEETNDLLRGIQRSLDRSRLGLINDPPGRRTIYANRVKAPDGCCWYFWDKEAQVPIPIEESAVRGVLYDLFLYEKTSEEGTTTKVRACLACGNAQYEVETSLYATSGTGLMSGLLEAGDSISEKPITIGVRPADKDQVLFVDVFTDDEGLQINDHQIAAGDEEAALSAVKTVRKWLGLDPDPWTDRFDDVQKPAQTPNQTQTNRQGPPPRGNTPAGGDGHQPAVPEASATRQNGHKSEKLYDQSSQTGPAPEQAAETIIAHAKKHPDGQLACNTQVIDDTLDHKLMGLAKYVGRDQGYVERVIDVLGTNGLADVPAGKTRDAIQMILDEEMLQQNETFEPDDELPF